MICIAPLRASLLALALVSGCALVDQRTFDAQAGTPPVVPRPPVAAVQPNRALDGMAPFVTIRPGRDTGYDQAVAQAARAALARKPDARFTVLSAVPPGTTDAQAAAVAELAPAAAHVATVIERRGVAPTRVQLQARAEPDLAARELRVYVH